MSVQEAPPPVASRSTVAKMEAAMALGSFAIGTGEFAIMGLMPDIASNLKLSEPEVGHAISAYALGVVVGAPALAILGSRLLRKHMLLLLMALYAIGNLATAFAPSFAGLVAFRFISGLPHGAYFGIAAVVASSMVPSNQRAGAVARVMMGLTVAMLLGNPIATWLGQFFGWRSAFILVGAIALCTIALVWYFVPQPRNEARSDPRKELQAFRLPQVWMALGIASIGFAGMFCVFSYLAPTLLGIGLVGTMIALAAPLQIRLMDIAHEAPSLAAASNHAAFNLANALGPWLGGMAITAGMGWTSTGYIGAVTALVGLGIYAAARRMNGGH